MEFMNSPLIAAAVVVAATALGWTVAISLAAAPIAFRDLDHGRADRLVRNMLKRSQPSQAVLCFIAGALAALGGAMAGGIVLAIAGVFFMMARWALAPREEKMAPAGTRRVLKTTRIVSAGLNAMMMPVIIAGCVMAVIGI
jgi:hypothetical protein